ncbi:MAG: TonB-dependent receptor, partial [Candidatus Eisenbacteria bacterium]|nr:TonB-dependent receptor [Candidatus Eisenbacteria bacterium]
SRSPGAPPTVVAVTGNPSVEAEEVRTYEIGYRFDLSDHSHFEAAAFASQYQSLLAVVQGEPSVLTFSTGPAVVIPLNIGNDSRRSTKGVELSWTWSPSRDLRFTTGYSWLHQDNKNADLTETGGANPAHTAFSWTSWEAGRGLSLDTILRYVDNLPSYSIPAYLAADVRVSRRWPGTVATSLSIRDLFAPNHREYQSDVIPTVTTSVDPSVRLEVSLGL